MLWKHFSYFPPLISRMWGYFLKLSVWKPGGILVGEINLDYGHWGFSSSHTEAPEISWSDHVFQPCYDSRGFCSRWAIIDCHSLCLPNSTESRWYFVLNSLMSLIKVNCLSVCSAIFLEWWNYNSKYVTCWSWNLKSHNHILMPRNYFKS